jgi:hypothetical protein
MKPNHQHEIQFLRYLDALDNGDANAIADFLAQAEHDPHLTQMLLDYHEQEETVNLKKIIPYPLNRSVKRKRKNGEYFINPLVASILLVLIGFLAGFGITRLEGNNPMAAVIPATAPITDFGYGGHVDTLDAAAIEAMQTANMTWVKYQVRYRQGYSADAIRTQIDIAHANGFRVMLQVVGVPDELNNENYFDSYGRFVGELAGYGADAIEVWNEPNIDREWLTGEIDPARYTELLLVAHQSIKAHNPNTFVITAGLAPTGAEDAFPNRVMNDDNFLRGMVEAGALNYADCVGLHYVEGIVAPSQAAGDSRDDYYTRYYPRMVATYRDITDGQLPLCFTELGYLTSEGVQLEGYFQWAQDTSRAEQTQWIDEAVQMAADSGGQVRIVILWSLNLYGEFETGYALLRSDGTCPACDALASPNDIEPGFMCEITLVDDVITLLETHRDSSGQVYNNTMQVTEPILVTGMEDGLLLVEFGQYSGTITSEDYTLTGTCDLFPIIVMPPQQ